MSDWVCISREKCDVVEVEIVVKDVNESGKRNKPTRNLCRPKNVVNQDK